MELNNLYMFQPNFLFGQNAHLPYACGTLAAYAFSDTDIKANYNLKKMQFLYEPIEDCVLQAENPGVLGFSTYVWNFEYNKALAEKFKKNYPSCLIVFGGHHVPPDGTLLEQCPFIDILIHGEGEEPFRQVLLSRLGKVNLDEIPNISFRKDGNLKTNQVQTYTHCNYPSPYLEGYFDSFFTDYPDLNFELLIETNRGCPYNCAFCDWGNLKSKIRCFPLEKVYRELAWACDHRIEFVACTDANFGILDRDEVIIDHIIDLKNKTGYPKKFQTSYAKNNSDRIFRIGKKLHDNAMNKGVTLSLQTLSEDAAANVGRANLSIEHYTELMRLYNAENIPTYTELILGLPGEDYTSLAKGLDDLLNAGQHHSVYIHNCEWLPCSVMGNPDYIKKYKIETTLIPINLPHMEHLKRGEIQEYSRIVTSTYSMDSLMWIDMNMLSYAVQCFHHMSLLQFFALYLHAEQGLGYVEFYERLLGYIMELPDTISGKIFKEIRNNLESILLGQGSLILFDEIFGDVSWPFEEYAFLRIVQDLEKFYDETEPFLRSFGISDDLMEDLLFYQRNMIKRPGGIFAQKKLRYNLHEYFTDIFKSGEGKLLRKLNLITIEDREPLDNWPDYARIVVWYGKKESKNIYTDSVDVKGVADE